MISQEMCGFWQAPAELGGFRFNMAKRLFYGRDLLPLLMRVRSGDLSPSDRVILATIIEVTAEPEWLIGPSGFTGAENKPIDGKQSCE